MHRWSALTSTRFGELFRPAGIARRNESADWPHYPGGTLGNASIFVQIFPLRALTCGGSKPYRFYGVF